MTTVQQPRPDVHYRLNAENVLILPGNQAQSAVDITPRKPPIRGIRFSGLTSFVPCTDCEFEGQRGLTASFKCTDGNRRCHIHAMAWRDDTNPNYWPISDVPGLIAAGA